MGLGWLGGLVGLEVGEEEERAEVVEGWGIGEGEEWEGEDEGSVEVVGWGEVGGEEARRWLRFVLESWPSAVLGVSGCRSCGGTGSRGR